MADHLDDDDFPDLSPEERITLARIYGNRLPKLSDRPTRTRPGSEGRLEVYEARFARGLSVLHPADAKLEDFPDDLCFDPERPHLTDGRGMSAARGKDWHLVRKDGARKPATENP